MTTPPPTDFDSLPDLLTTDQAALALGLLPGSLRRYVYRGLLAGPVAREKKRVLYRRDDLRAFAQNRRHRPEETTLQRLERRLEELERRNEDLERRNEELERRVRAMEARP